MKKLSFAVALALSCAFIAPAFASFNPQPKSEQIAKGGHGHGGHKGGKIGKPAGKKA